MGEQLGTPAVRKTRWSDGWTPRRVGARLDLGRVGARLGQERRVVLASSH